MDRTFEGIDPGADGAVARITGSILEVEDCPTLPAATGRGLILDRRGMRDVIRRHPEVAFTLIEAVAPRPNDGKVTAWKFALNYSAWMQVLVDHDRDFRQVIPQTWKRAVGVTADKATSVRRAQALFPKFAHLFVGPLGGLLHGRAEAALLAWFAQRTWKMEGRK